MRATRSVSAALFALLLSMPLLAQHEGRTSAPAPANGFRAEAVSQLAGMEKKLVSLAEATPADEFAWRPAEGVRSVGEVYAHVAGGNCFLMSLLGLKLPDGIDLQSLEASFDDKAAIIAAMQESFKFVNAEIGKLSYADLERAMTFLGKETTARGIVLLSIEHVSEHLGQSIAYARMNGVTPPWSRKGD